LAAADNGSEADWFDRPMRWAQLTLVENDPGQYDPAFWLDYFKRIHADAACLSAGGVVAYYPTEVPLHHRSAWLGNRDCFGELLEGCRRLGMVVIARTDPHAAHQDVYDAHPDWIAVDADGRPRRHWASPELWVTCALGPYNFDFMTRVHREIATRYDVGGIFGNRWSGSGMCYCEHCRRNFTAATGHVLPRTNDPHDAARRAYLAWHQQRLFELWRLWNDEIRAIRPHARFIANAGGGALSPLDMKTVGELSDILFADRQARSGLTASVRSSCSSCPTSPAFRSASAISFAVSSATAEASSRRTRRRCTTSRAHGAAISGSPICSARGSAAAWKGRCRIRICGWRRTPSAPRTRSSPGSTARRGSSTACGASKLSPPSRSRRSR
jgi:hypothetical protein